MGEAALSGNLSAVGLFDLLRIPMTTARTGTLIVVNSDPEVAEPEARLYYREGTLIAGTLGRHQGEQALRGLLGWKEGFFEFLADTEPPEHGDPNLHAVALAEIKAWYASKTSNRPALTGNRSSNPAVQVQAQVPRSSSPGISRPEVVPAALRALPQQPQQPQQPKARPTTATGSAALDARANLSDVVGVFSPKDGALAFAALQLATTIGKDMVMGAPRTIEVHAKEKWLGAAPLPDGAVVVVCPPDSPIAEELARRSGGT